MEKISAGSRPSSRSEVVGQITSTYASKDLQINAEQVASRQTSDTNGQYDSSDRVGTSSSIEQAPAAGRPSWREKFPSNATLRPILLTIILVCAFTIFLELFIESTTNKYRHLGWLIPFLLWLATSMRFIAMHPFTRKYSSMALRAVFRITGKVFRAFTSILPPVLKNNNNALLTVATLILVLAGTFASKESEGNTRENRAISLVGLFIFIISFWATSRNRSIINWQAVIGGTAAQFILGLFVLKTKAGYDIFNFVGDMAKKLLGYSSDGTTFLTTSSVPKLGWFLVTVVPAVTFFVAFVYLLHHWGWVGWLVKHFATVFTYLLGISGAEAIVAAASPFIGQGESAILVREYLGRMTDAEIHQVMTSGFATISGSVMSAYMNMGISPVAIISSCVMSIPASIALSKLRYPEAGTPVTSTRTMRCQAEVDMEEARSLDNGQPGDDLGEHKEERAYNALHAFSTGAGVGLRVAGLIVANVLSILALLGLANGLLHWWGTYHDVDDFSVQFILGYIMYPVAFLLGVDFRNDGGGDLRKVAQLLGIKIVANEFVAFGDLTTDAQYSSLAPRSRFIAMYALCGFGNLSAVGIQIGVLTQLSPRRGGDVAKVAFSALITGIVATLTSASIAGMLMDGKELF